MKVVLSTPHEKAKVTEFEINLARKFIGRSVSAGELDVLKTEIEASLPEDVIVQVVEGYSVAGRFMSCVPDVARIMLHRDCLSPEAHARIEAARSFDQMAAGETRVLLGKSVKKVDNHYVNIDGCDEAVYIGTILF